MKMSNKTIDKGNKRRFIKNVVRMVKHPFAYIAWKINPTALPKRILYFVFLGALSTMIIRYTHLHRTLPFT